ncbi:MAG: AAA family ATPase [Alphaproteobacteria bacterium]|nr:AAA family ATPase [Candidatus Parcubacteria bacterium]NCQ67554.1 AAA family ATPase [Alphaproteobacteria bacterium]
MILLQELHENGDDQSALDYLQEHPSKDFQDLELTVLAGEIALKAESFDLASAYCSGESAEEKLIRARAYLAQSHYQKGLESYLSAIALNPILEDPTLEKTLKEGVSTISQTTRSGNVVGFRVLTNANGGLKQKGAVEEEEEYLSIFQPQKSSLTFKDVGGLSDVKKQIHRKIILPFQKPSLFQKFKKKAGGGVLLYGPPGCGKTLLARATAGECKTNFYNIAISDILDMWIGESEKKLKAVFETARQNAPSVLFFDELEALAGKRHYSTDSSASKTVSQFLSEMDGFANNNQGVLIIGATNVPWSIDSAFRRAGRFDRVLFIPPPDKEARLSILQILMADRPTDGKIDLDSFAKMTGGFSGADLSNLIETACDHAIEQSIDSGSEVPLSKEMLTLAFKEVKRTTMEWLTTARNYAKYANDDGQYNDVLEFLKKHGKA